MNFLKAFLFTVIYLVLCELLTFWVFLFSDDVFISTILAIQDPINDIIYLTLSIVFFKYVLDNEALKIRKTTPKFIILGILLGIGYVFFQTVLNTIYYFDFDDFYVYEFTLDRLHSLSIISSILIVPIYEELFFRNYIQRKLSQQYKPFLAIFLASLLFAFIHLPVTSIFFDFIDFSWHHAYIALFGGLISGVLFYKSKSIIPSILFHMFWNLTVSVF